MDFRVFVEPQQGASYADQLAVAQAAEALGYSAFFRSDHYVAMSGDGLPGPTDSWVTLGALARETSRIRLGTMVTSATFRHPGPLAISVAQVDDMSDGRVDFGIGAGWFAKEHEAYAIPFGEANVTREGDDATIIAFGRMVNFANDVADKLSKQGITCTVVDPRTTSPLDTDTILETAAETGRVVVVDEAHPRCNMATDISALVTSNVWDKLKAAPQLVTAPHAPVPFSPALEDLYLPSAEKIETPQGTYTRSVAAGSEGLTIRTTATLQTGVFGPEVYPALAGLTRRIKAAEDQVIRAR